MFGKQHQRYPDWFTTSLIDHGKTHLVNPNAVISFDGFTLHDDYENEFMRVWPDACLRNCVYPDASEDRVQVMVPLTLDEVVSFKEARFGRIWYKLGKNLQGLSDTEFRYQFPLYYYEGVNTDAIDTLIRIATEPGFKPNLRGEETGLDFFDELAQHAEEAGLVGDDVSKATLPVGNFAICAQSRGVGVLQNVLDAASGPDATSSYLTLIAQGAVSEGCTVLTIHTPISVAVTEKLANELRIKTPVMAGWISRSIATEATQ